MAEITCLVTYDEQEIFNNEIKSEGLKAYVTATPLDEHDHVTSQVFDKNIYIGEVNGSLYAKEFHGNLIGNANSATKLGSSNIGSATQPMYLNAGTPTECTYTLGKSVPNNAVFTDTKVTQAAAITTNAKYPILLGYSEAITAITDTVNKAAALTYNPNTKILVVVNINASGTIKAGEFIEE